MLRYLDNEQNAVNRVNEMRDIVRIGISLTSAYDVANPREGARWMIERAAAAHGADLDSLFVGDHHSTAPSTYSRTSRSWVAC